MELINNIVFVSGERQCDSIIHIYVSLLFQILFPFGLLQNIEQSSLCCTVGPCCYLLLSILNRAVRVYLFPLKILCSLFYTRTLWSGFSVSSLSQDHYSRSQQNLDYSPDLSDLWNCVLCIFWSNDLSLLESPDLPPSSDFLLCFILV